MNKLPPPEETLARTAKRRPKFCHVFERDRRMTPHLPRAPERAKIAYPESPKIGYSPQVRGLLGAGSRSALPLRFSVIFEYGGLIP
jgi:hypothetical protein